MSSTDTPCRDQACTARHCLCSCGRHLDPLDQTCIHCLGACRRWLRAIPDLAAQIVDQLDGYPAASPGISERTSRNADTPLMGGDRTSLTGPGSDGANAGGQPHASDNQPTDPPSVLWELHSWERDWRETIEGPEPGSLAQNGPQERGMDQSGTSGYPLSDRATLTTVTSYLLDHLSWAAQRHPAFDDFHAEIRQLHQLLEHAAGATDRPIVDVAECFGCPHIRLRRDWTHSGLSDDWHCPRCKRRYLAEDYYRARTAYYEQLRDKADAQEGAG